MGRSLSPPPSSPVTRKMLVTSAEGEVLLLGQLFLYFVIMIIILALCRSTFDVPGPCVKHVKHSWESGIYIIFVVVAIL